MKEDRIDRRQEMIKRGRKIDLILGTSWVADHTRYLWENPEEYATNGIGRTENPSRGEDLLLFKFAFNMGVEYERQFPTDQQEEWEVEDLD